MNKPTYLLAALLLALPSLGNAQLFRIDSQASVVHTTYWSNWPWTTWGNPDDGIDLAVQGTFEMSITPGGTNVWTGAPIPDRIAFTDIDVSSSSAPGRSWVFPEFQGFFFGPDLQGSTDDCLAFQYTSSGSCYSAGVPHTYQGTFDGQSIRFTGGISWDMQGANAYFYEITATAVPEPASIAFMVVGLGMLLARKHHRL